MAARAPFFPIREKGGMSPPQAGRPPAVIRLIPCSGEFSPNYSSAPAKKFVCSRLSEYSRKQAEIKTVFAAIAAHKGSEIIVFAVSFAVTSESRPFVLSAPGGGEIKLEHALVDALKPLEIVERDPLVDRVDGRVRQAEVDDRAGVLDEAGVGRAAAGRQRRTASGHLFDRVGDEVGEGTRAGSRRRPHWSDRKLAYDDRRPRPRPAGRSRLSAFRGSRGR